MEIKGKNIDVKQILLVLFMDFALMPDIISFNGKSIKPMYFIFFALAGYTVYTSFTSRPKFPDKILSLSFLYVVLVSFISAPVWGIDRLTWNYCFGFVVITIFINIGSEYSEDTWMKMLNIVWITLVVCVTANDLRQINNFIEYLNIHSEHPQISTLVTGNVNLEATWIALLAFSFFKNKNRWFTVIVSILFSLIYGSRAGLICSILLFLFFVFGKLPTDSSEKLIKRRVIWSILATVLIVLCVAITAKGSFDINLISRVGRIGKEGGSLGRLRIWEYFVPTLLKYPFGVGLGNSISALETISPYTYAEDNLHNLYMQMFVDAGFVGGFLFLFLVGYWFVKNIKVMLTSPICAMLLSYFIVALVQFKGGETIFFSLIGIYLCIRNQKPLST